MSQYWLVDRRTEKIDSFISHDVSREDFPYAIQKTSPPFVLGKTIALVHRKDEAEKIIALLSTCE
jgi:hypothetical protein